MFHFSNVRPQQDTQRTLAGCCLCCLSIHRGADRSRRRRFVCVALLWVSLVQGRAPSVVKEPGASVLKGPAAGKQGGSLCCRSDGVAVASSPSAEKDASSQSLGVGCTSTPTSALPPDNGTLGTGRTAAAAAAAAAATAAATQLAAREVSGGAVFHRNRRDQPRRLQPPPPRSDTRTYATDRSANGTAWPEISRVLKKCLRRAGSGGLPGAMAGLLQVITLMWLRTIVNYQCRYGTSIGAAASELYRQGGVLRFYRGVVFALVSNPLSRFGMAAANEGAIALIDALPREVYYSLLYYVHPAGGMVLFVSNERRVSGVLDSQHWERNVACAHGSNPISGVLRLGYLSLV